MIFWAAAYKFQEGVYWDFEKDDLTSDLKESCFLPTKEMAENFIEKELDDDYAVVEITLLRLEENGVWSYSNSRVPEWEEF